jgi:energy-coupling factor transporter ATP-binding protein EcfA2
MHDRDISLFARTNGREPVRRFGIHQADRLFHMYLVGKTGSGKSTLMETLASEDIAAGRGCVVLDPHGDLVERLAYRVPVERQGETIYLDVPDTRQPYGYNPLRHVSRDRIPLAASGLMEALKKLWSEAWGVRMEHVLRNTLYALLEYGEATLPDILRILADTSFRREVLAKVTNEQVRYFWRQEFPKYNPRYRQEMIAPIQNKVGAFLADPRLRAIFIGEKQELRFRKIMDGGGVFLANLSKGALGDDSSNLLGSLLVTTLSLAAYSRVEIPPEERRPFFIYLDEFQLFTTLSTANMVSELRKFGIGLVLAHQHLHQLEPEVRHAILANMGTVITFRLGPEDAEFFAREYEGVFTSLDLMNLANYDIYLRLMINGSPSRPFSATTLLPSQVRAA